MKSPIRVRHTPNCAHAYTATMKGDGAYGWGSTPDQARECLMRRITEQVGAVTGIKPGVKVHCFGDVATVVRIKSRDLAAVMFTGKTIDGRFGELKGGCDALIKNLTLIASEK